MDGPTSGYRAGMPFPDEEFARHVAVVDHDPRWAGEFEQLATRLRAALGPAAVAIDHIGSTAVAGLPAKDCIDVQVRVHRIDDPAVPHALAELGFRRRPEPWNQHEIDAGRSWPKLVFAPPVGARACNVHVRESAAATARRNLLFRDYLRADRRAHHAWAEFKRRLAELSADLFDYGKVKQPATEVLMIAAEGWAIRNSWRP